MTDNAIISEGARQVSLAIRQAYERGRCDGVELAAKMLEDQVDETCRCPRCNVLRALAENIRAYKDDT